MCRARAYGCVAWADEPIARRLGKIYDELTRVISKVWPHGALHRNVYFGSHQGAP